MWRRKRGREVSSHFRGVYTPSSSGGALDIGGRERRRIISSIPPQGDNTSPAAGPSRRRPLENVA